MKLKLLRQILIMSRYAFYGLSIQLFLCSFLWAKNGNSQNIKKLDSIYVSLNLHNATLNDAFERISEQTDFLFSHKLSKGKLDKQVKINTGIKNETLGNVLRDLSREYGLGFKRINENIFVKKYKRNDHVIEEVISENFAQIKVSGKVTSASDGEPLPGVSILIKGTTLGTTSDVDGNYIINAQENSVLQFSYIGFETYEVQLANQTELNVQMNPDLEQLEEVVVVGYGTQKKSDVISAISTVDAKEIKKVPTSSFVQALQGTTPGLNMVSSSGEPNAGARILIRGVGSITTDTEPLFIVDGIPVASGGTSPLNYLSPNDIKSISVLKDASATAIYGSRGANGVVLITTKTGVVGQTNFNVGYERGFTSPINTLEIANADDWRQTIGLARENSGLGGERFKKEQDLFDKRHEQRFIDLDIYNSGNTNWIDMAKQNGSFDQYSFSASNATEKTNLYFSGQYRDQTGNFINTRFQRYTSRINFDFNATKFLKMGVRYQFSLEKNDRRGPGSQTSSSVNRVDRNLNYGAWAEYGALYKNALPIFPQTWPDNGEPFDVLSRNNITYSASRDNAVNDFRNNKHLGTAYLEITPVKGLTLKAEAGIDHSKIWDYSWISGRLRVEEFREEDLGNDDRLLLDYPYEDGKTRFSWADNSFFTYNFIGTAAYNRTFANDHNFSALLGIEAIENDSDNWQHDWENASSNQDEKEMGAFVRSADQLFAINHFKHGGARFYSQFGRVNYNYKGKYLFQGSLRRDGSSKFTPEDRFSWFPSASAGWIISDENFMQQAPALSYLKLRGGWGITGNANIGGFLYVNDYWTWPNYPNRSGALTLKRLGSQSIQWEKSNTVDVALEFGFLDNRINASIGYYYTKTTNLLLSFPVTPSVGIYATNNLSPKALDNVGSMENKGIEFEINTINIHKGDFKWTSAFNITTNKNKVLELYPGFDGDPLQFSYNGLTTVQEGHPLGMFYLPEFAGYDDHGNVLIREIDQQKAVDQVYEFTGNNVRNIGSNTNANSVIQYGKTGLPTFFGGFNNVLTYKGFSLSFLFTFQGGHYIYDNIGMTRAGTGTGNFRKDVVGNTWIPDNPNAKYPVLTWGNLENNPEDPNELAQNMSSRSSFWLEKGDMIRLRNISLNYSLPDSWFGKNFMKGANIYMNMNNVATFSKFKTVDPEVLTNGGAQARNIGQGVISGVPFWQVFTVAGGVNVRF